MFAGSQSVAFQEQKQTQPLTRERAFTWEPALSSSFSSCFGLYPQARLCCGITSASWEHTFKGISTTPSPAPTASRERRTLKCWKCQPLQSFVSGEIQEQWTPRWRPNCDLFSFLSACALPLHRHPKILLQHEVCWLRWPAPSKHMQSRFCYPPLDKCLDATLTDIPSSPRA